MNKAIPSWAKILNNESLISKLDAVSILGVCESTLDRAMRSRGFEHITLKRKCFYKFGDIKRIIEESA